MMYDFSFRNFIKDTLRERERERESRSSPLPLPPLVLRFWLQFLLTQAFSPLLPPVFLFCKTLPSFLVFLRVRVFQSSIPPLPSLIARLVRVVAVAPVAVVLCYSPVTPCATSGRGT